MFKVRDLLLVGAICVGATVGWFREDVCSAARRVAEPVLWYVDAPQREADMEREFSHRLAAAKKDCESQLSEMKKSCESQLQVTLFHLREEELKAESLKKAAAEAESRAAALAVNVARLQADLHAARSDFASLKSRLLDLGTQTAIVAE